MQLKANNILFLLQSMVVLDLPYYTISPLLVWYSQQSSFDEEFHSLFLIVLKNVVCTTYKYCIIESKSNIILFLLMLVHVGFTILQHFFVVGMMVFITIEF